MQAELEPGYTRVPWTDACMGYGPALSGEFCRRVRYVAPCTVCLFARQQGLPANTVGALPQFKVDVRLKSMCV